MTRPTTCRFCGTAIRQASTGRPRQFCGDLCRHGHTGVMRLLQNVRPPFGEPLFHNRDADRRLRALHAELRSTTRSCYTIANELQLSGDVLNEVRFAAAGAALERVLGECFTDLEEKP